MTREEAKEQLKQIPIHDGVSDNYLKTIYEAIDIAIKSLEQQPCEDCISRAKAIEEANKLCLETGYDNEKVIEMLNDLPSVTPKKKTGKSNDPLESFLGYMKNIYFQNKDEVDKVAKEMMLDKEKK